MKVTTQISDLVRGFNTFGLRLYGKLPRGENCFLSPLSIATALSALLCGAQGKTGDELAQLLGVEYPPEAFSGRVGRLLESLIQRRAQDYVFDPEGEGYREVEKDVFRLHVANALIAQHGYALNPAYCAMLESDLLAEVLSVDFKQPGPVATQINNWVAEKTHGMITNLLDGSAIGPLTRLILVNAVYFLAEWLDPFEESLTSPQPFYLLPGGDTECVEVPMMRQTLPLQYMVDETLGLEAVRIPYKAMSMLVLLPRPGRFQAVEDALHADLLQAVLAALGPHEVSLELPKFEMESSFELREVMMSLGVHTAFDEHRAEWSGISDDPEGLVLSEVFHRARVRVDEQGTEAAAATAVAVLAGIEEMERPQPIPFIVNRPFIFLIRDDETNAILFLGRVTIPLE